MSSDLEQMRIRQTYNILYGIIKDRIQLNESNFNDVIDKINFLSLEVNFIKKILDEVYLNIYKEESNK